MRGAAVSMEVGFPGVEPYDKFLIEPIEESEELELELELLAFLFFLSWKTKFSWDRTSSHRHLITA